MCAAHSATALVRPCTEAKRGETERAHISRPRLRSFTHPTTPFPTSPSRAPPASAQPPPPLHLSCSYPFSSIPIAKRSAGRMWRRSGCRLELARTALRLSVPPRTGEATARPPKTAATSATAPATSPSKQTQPAAARTHAPGTAHEAAPSDYAALTHAVEQLRDMSRRTQQTVRVQDESLRQLQQELHVLVRRVNQAEAATDQLRAKLSEVHRAVGEVMLNQRNTDLLVQQVERRQVSHSPAPASTGEGPSCGGHKSDAAVASSPASVAPTAAAVASAEAPTNAHLASQVQALQARLDQLTTDLFAADRVRVVAERMTSAGVPVDVLAAAASATSTTISAASPPTAPVPSRAALLQQLQRRHALGVFVDPAGVTRLASQVVHVHNVPLNFGAGDVRQLCIQHVCADHDAAELISCMVHRRTAADRAPSAATVGGAPQQAPRAQPEQLHPAPSSSPPHVEQTAAAAAARVGSLPRGDAVAAMRHDTKTFEVVFASTAAAVRALRALNGLQLRPSFQERPLPLIAEPVVSADVVAALKAWEDEAARASGSDGR